MNRQVSNFAAVATMSLVLGVSAAAGRADDKGKVVAAIDEALDRAQRDLDASELAAAERELKGVEALLADESASVLDTKARAAFAAKLADLRATLLRKGSRDSIAGGAAKLWLKCREANERDSTGWEKETPPEFKDWVASDPPSLHAPLTEKFYGLSERWFSQERVKLALHDYPDDAELRRTYEEVQKVREAAGSKLCEFAGRMLDAAEAHGPVLSGTDLRPKVVHLVGYLDRHARACAAHPGTVARARALLKKWESEDPKAGARAQLAAKLTTAATELWPSYVKAFELVKLDPAAALADMKSWRGKYVSFPKVARGVDPGFWGDRNEFVALVDGQLVAARFDLGVEEALLGLEKQTGISFDYDEHPLEAFVAAVESPCAVEKRFANPFNKKEFVRGGGRDGLMLRIVAVKAGPFALAVTQGTSLARISGQPEIPVDESGRFGKGAIGFPFRR